MKNPPDTRPSLVLRLGDARDAAAWEEFVSLYEPFLFSLLRRNGLQEHDARDVLQQVLLAITRDVQSWRPDGKQASFRRWLYRVARNRLLSFLESSRRLPKAGVEIGEAADPAWDAEKIDQEARHSVFLWAAEKVRCEFHPVTWSAFWRTWIEGEPIAMVAKELSLTKGSVYLARCRIVARLREKVAQWEDETCPNPV